MWEMRLRSDWVASPRLMGVGGAKTGEKPERHLGISAHNWQLAGVLGGGGVEAGPHLGPLEHMGRRRELPPRKATPQKG